MPRRGTDAHARLLDRWKLFATGSGFAWIATEGERRSDQILQMLSRVGYPLAPAGHTPRRALADLLWA